MSAGGAAMRRHQQTQLVTIATPKGGTVVADNLTPSQDDVVTITVTPDAGYKIEKAGIIVEATIDPGYAHAPAMAAPAVGYYLPLEGEQPENTSLEASYTFVMPEQPFNVLVTATFTPAIPTSVSETTAAQPVTSVCYVDLSGRVSPVPHAGINVVVTTYANGTRTVARILK